MKHLFKFIDQARHSLVEALSPPFFPLPLQCNAFYQAISSSLTQKHKSSNNINIKRTTTNKGRFFVDGKMEEQGNNPRSSHRSNGGDDDDGNVEYYEYEYDVVELKKDDKNSKNRSADARSATVRRSATGGGDHRWNTNTSTDGKDCRPKEIVRRHRSNNNNNNNGSSSQPPTLPPRRRPRTGGRRQDHYNKQQEGTEQQVQEGDEEEEVRVVVISNDDDEDDEDEQEPDVSYEDSATSFGDGDDDENYYSDDRSYDDYDSAEEDDEFYYNGDDDYYDDEDDDDDDDYYDDDDVSYASSEEYTISVCDLSTIQEETSIDLNAERTTSTRNSLMLNMSFGSLLSDNNNSDVEFTENETIENSRHIIYGGSYSTGRSSSVGVSVDEQQRERSRSGRSRSGRSQTERSRSGRSRSGRTSNNRGSRSGRMQQQRKQQISSKSESESVITTTTRATSTSTPSLKPLSVIEDDHHHDDENDHQQKRLLLRKRPDPFRNEYDDVSSLPPRPPIRSSQPQHERKQPPRSPSSSSSLSQQASSSPTRPPLPPPPLASAYSSPSRTVNDMSFNSSFGSLGLGDDDIDNSDVEESSPFDDDGGDDDDENENEEQDDEDEDEDDDDRGADDDSITGPTSAVDSTDDVDDDDNDVDDDSPSAFKGDGMVESESTGEVIKASGDDNNTKSLTSVNISHTGEDNITDVQEPSLKTASSVGSSTDHTAYSTESGTEFSSHGGDDEDEDENTFHDAESCSIFLRMMSSHHRRLRKMLDSDLDGDNSYNNNSSGGGFGGSSSSTSIRIDVTGPVAEYIGEFMQERKEEIRSLTPSNSRNDRLLMLRLRMKVERFGGERRRRSFGRHRKELGTELSERQNKTRLEQQTLDLLDGHHRRESFDQSKRALSDFFEEKCAIQLKDKKGDRRCLLSSMPSSRRLQCLEPDRKKRSLSRSFSASATRSLSRSFSASASSATSASSRRGLLMMQRAKFSKTMSDRHLLGKPSSFTPKHNVSSEQMMYLKHRLNAEKFGGKRRRDSYERSKKQLSPKLISVLTKKKKCFAEIVNSKTIDGCVGLNSIDLQ